MSPNLVLYTCCIHFVYILYTCVVYMCWIHVLYTCCLHVVYMCCIHVLCTCVVQMWYTCVVYMCCIHVVNLLYTCCKHVVYMYIAWLPTSCMHTFQCCSILETNDYFSRNWRFFIWVDDKQTKKGETHTVSIWWKSASCSGLPHTFAFFVGYMARLSFLTANLKTKQTFFLSFFRGGDLNLITGLSGWWRTNESKQLSSRTQATVQD